MATDLWRPLQQNYSWALLWKDDPDVCVAQALASLYIIPPTYNFSIFLSGLRRVEVWPQRRMANWKNHYYGHYYYYNYNYYCFSLFSYYITYHNLFFVRLWLLKYSIPPRRPRFFSHHVRVQVQGPLFVIYISRWKLLNISFLVLLVPFEHLQPKLLSG